MSLLDIGASGQLLVNQEIEEVLPLDDANLLDQAKPITSQERIHFDQAKVKAVSSRKRRPAIS
jgi:hypothetical protein